MRDGLKSSGIGQSAAKSVWFLEVTDLTTDILAFNGILRGVGSPPAGSDLVLEEEAESGFLPLATKVREYLSNQVGGDAVSPDDRINRSAGPEFGSAAVDVLSGSRGYEFDRSRVAHGDFDDRSILVSYRATGSFEAVYSEATFTVEKASDVGLCDFVHDQTLTSNDYPEREYGQVPGSARHPSSYQMKGGDIVFSSLKDEAAPSRQGGGVGVTTRRENKPYVNDDYCAIGWPSTFRNFKQELEAIHQYTEAGFTLIHNGEIGRYENTRYVEQTHIPKGGAFDSTTWNAQTDTADAWDGADSDWIFFFGEDTVAEAIVIPEEMRGKIPSDYGRSKGIAWYALLGYGQTQTSAAESRICKWDSNV